MHAFQAIDIMTLDTVTGGFDLGAAFDNGNLWGARGLQAGSYLGGAIGAVAGTVGGAATTGGAAAAPGWYVGAMGGGLVGGAAGGAIGFLGGFGSNAIKQLRGK
jgi:hypothetical protein